MKKILLAGAALLLIPQAAHATDDGFPGEFSGTLGFVSQYSFRGLAQSDEHPAVQGSFDYKHDSGFYAGIWGSNVDFNDGDEASLEADLYAGWSGAFNDVSVTAGAIYYAYPGADDDLNYDFYEVLASVGYDFKVVSLTGSLNYSPEYFADSGDALYAAANAKIPLPAEFALNLHYGYQSIDEEASFGSPDYSDWSAGVSRSFEGFDFSLNYVDTDLDDGTECVSGWCDSRVIFGVSRAF